MVGSADPTYKGGRLRGNEISFLLLDLKGTRHMAQALSNEHDLRTDAVDFSYGEIVNLHSSDELQIYPEYQRLFRWTDEQKSRLIESVFIQLPIPPIFLVENDDGVLELIDGLQRISSVIQFIDAGKIKRDPLHLVGCDIIKELNGKTFEDLALSDRLRIKRTSIRAVIIRRQGSSFIKYELFKRLNTGGSLLSAQEVRNCSSRMVEGGDVFYLFLQEMAFDEHFKKAISRMPALSREQRGDEELVLRYFAVVNYLDGYHGNVEEWLNSYMENILFGHTSFSMQDQQTAFLRIFKFIADVFGGDAFARRRDDGEALGRLAPAYFEAVVGAITSDWSNISVIDHELLKYRLGLILVSKEFREVTGPGANTITKMKGRISLVQQALRGEV
jgi:hypothetical protein